MQFLIYILIYPFIWFLSILPFRMLYFLSDCIYFLVYYIIGYRKKTVRENLALALPHLTVKQRLRVEKKFFSHLCDTFMEMAKTMTISRKEIERRFRFTNLNDYLEYEKKEKSIALLCGHYASYEWAISVNHYINYRGVGIYKKISNKYFDKLVHDIRSRFKAHLVTTKATVSTIEENYHKKVLCVYGFANDQSPKLTSTFHWKKFMGMEVPIQTAAEMLSKKFDMNVLFLRVKKIKRGFYEASFELLSDNAKAVPDYEITDRFMELVEKQILEAPEYYLWTHKRWKHRR